jgi:hypothetical protein
MTLTTIMGVAPIIVVSTPQGPTVLPRKVLAADANVRGVRRIPSDLASAPPAACHPFTNDSCGFELCNGLHSRHFDVFLTPVRLDRAAARVRDHGHRTNQCARGWAHGPSAAIFAAEEPRDGQIQGGWFVSRTFESIACPTNALCVAGGPDASLYVRADRTPTSVDQAGELDIGRAGPRRRRTSHHSAS